MRKLAKEPFPFWGSWPALSLNLAVVNLLPIPILDGATIFMLLVEMLMRRDLSLRVKEAAFRLGFVFMMAMVAFVIYNDISNWRLSSLTVAVLNRVAVSKPVQLALRRQLIRRYKHRLNIHRNPIQPLQRLLHIRPDDAQLIQHLLGARVVARRFNGQQIMIQVANRAANLRRSSLQRCHRDAR